MNMSRVRTDQIFREVWSVLAPWWPKKLVKVAENDSFPTIKSKFFDKIALKSMKLSQWGWARTDQIF